MDIAELLQRVRRGDATAAQELVQSYHSEVFRLALSILDDPADAEDITQDVFIAAIHALDSYRGDSAFKTWLFSIAVNVCRRRWRQRKTRERLMQVLQSIFPLIGAGSVHPEDVLIRRENRAELWQAVNGLNEKYRLPLALFYGHELPVAEIAQILDIPVGTVLSRLHTAREHLAVTLGSEDETEIQYEVSEP
ncbi:MAG TPA: sigma-70 family RNA polymerase sigma factor [Anaerolineales bacterium]|nr:sigma-70 family RNA polymerase sigma factor [Anaerolineales bacterium]